MEVIKEKKKRVSNTCTFKLVNKFLF